MTKVTNEQKNLIYSKLLLAQAQLQTAILAVDNEHVTQEDLQQIGFSLDDLGETLIQIINPGDDVEPERFQ